MVFFWCQCYISMVFYTGKNLILQNSLPAAEPLRQHLPFHPGVILSDGILWDPDYIKTSLVQRI